MERAKKMLELCAEWPPPKTGVEYAIVEVLELKSLHILPRKDLKITADINLWEVTLPNKKTYHALIIHTGEKGAMDKLLRELIKYRSLRKQYKHFGTSNQSTQTETESKSQSTFILESSGETHMDVAAMVSSVERHDPIEHVSPLLPLFLKDITCEDGSFHLEDTPMQNDNERPEEALPAAESFGGPYDSQEEVPRMDYSLISNEKVPEEMVPTFATLPGPYSVQDEVIHMDWPRTPTKKVPQGELRTIEPLPGPSTARDEDTHMHWPRTPNEKVPEGELRTIESLPGSSTARDESEIFMEGLSTPAAATQSSGSGRATSSTSSRKRTKKKHFCKYCKKIVTNFKRHITTLHELEDDVVTLKKASTLSTQVALLRKIMAEGDYMYFQMNPDKPIVRRETGSNEAAWDTCPECKMLVSKNHSVQHYRKCNPQAKGLSGQAVRVEIIREELQIVNTLSNDMKNKILPYMRNDKIKQLCETDASLILYGNQLCIRLKGESQEKTIRNHLRVVARVVQKTIEVHKEIDGTISSVAQIFEPLCYDSFIKAIHDICGYGQAEGEEMKKPTTPHQYGPKVKEMSDYILTELLKQSDPNNPNNAIQAELTRKIERIKAWQDIYVRDFDKQVASLGRKQAERRTYDTRQLTPSMHDVQKLIDYIENTTKTSYEVLKENFDLEAWKTLSKCLLLRLWIFNRRRVGEVDVLRLQNWLRAKDVDENSDQFKSLSTTEQTFASSFKRLSVRAKLRRPAALLVAKKDLDRFDLMISLRDEANVKKDNIYLFATHDRYIEGTAVMSEFAKKCGARDWKLLTGTRLRKQLAASLRYLNLTDEDLRLVAEAMGHTEKTHLTHYRAHDAALHAGRVSKLLMAMDDGTIDVFKGKSLEEMNVEVTLENIPSNEQLDSLDVDVDANGDFITEKEKDVLPVAQSALLRTPSPHEEQYSTPIKTSKRKTKTPSLEEDSSDEEENVSYLQRVKRKNQWETDVTSMEEESEDAVTRGNTPGRKRAFARRKQHKKTKWSDELKAALRTQLSEEIKNKTCPSTSRVLEAIGALEQQFPEIVNHSPKKVKVVVTNMFKK